MYDQIEEKTVILPPFKHFIMSVGEIPSSYLETMTYYEMLVWFTNYLGNTVIPAINENGEAVTELQNLFVELQTYVNDYFNNLDVQEEINNKLDDMTEDGSLQNIVGQYIRSDIIPLINDQNEEITEFKNDINSDVDDLTARVNGIASGAPIPVSSTSDMTDTTKIYLLTTDGYWYYYNGSAWTQGDEYQTTHVSNTDLGVDGRNTKTSNLAYYDGYEKLTPINNIYTIVLGELSGNNNTEIQIGTSEHRKILQTPITLSYYEDMELINMSNGNLSYRVFETDSDDIIIKSTSWLTTNYWLHGRSDRKYYLMFQITGHYNYDVEEYDLSQIRIRQNQITRQPYLHTLFDVNVYPFTRENNYTADSTTRCMTDFIYYSGKIKIKTDYQFLVMQYKKSDKDYIHDETSWLDSGYYTFSKNYYYRLLFRKSDNSTITPSEVLANTLIFPMEQADSSVDYSMPNIILNNHQGYSSDYNSGMNLANSYYNSFLQGYKYAECDIKFTLDNVPVCSHDDSFTDGGTTVVIAETNYADLVEYDYYDGNHISSLDDVMLNCKKYGLTLQLDQLSSTWSDTQWNNLFAVIKKYQMEEFVMYSAGNQTLISKILSFDDKATCVILGTTSNFNDCLNNAINNKNGKNKFIIMFNQSTVYPEDMNYYNQQLQRDIYLGLYTIDNIQTALDMIPYVYMITTNKITPSDIINEFVH